LKTELKKLGFFNAGKLLQHGEILKRRSHFALYTNKYVTAKNRAKKRGGA